MRALTTAAVGGFGAGQNNKERNQKSVKSKDKEKGM
jgi:hypothetical protein